MKLSSVVIAILGVTCSALEETNQVRALKGKIGKGVRGDKGGKKTTFPIAGGKKGKAAKVTSTGTFAPTVYKNSKSKSPKSSESGFVCPLSKGGKSGSKGKSTKSPFPDAFPDGPGSIVLISPADDASLCVQPEELVIGAAVIMGECTYSESEAFTVDRYGRLQSSEPGLCVQGDGGDLVLGSCDTCSAFFQYDEEQMTISPMEDTSVVFTAEDGVMTLQPLARRRLKAERIIDSSQKFEITLFTGVPPTSSPAPTGSLVPLPTSSPAPTSLA